MRCLFEKMSEVHSDCEGDLKKGSPLAEKSIKNRVLLALTQPVERRRLLQQRNVVRDILNDVPARKLLFTHACSVQASAQALAESKSLIVEMMKCSRLIWRGGAIAPQVYDEALSRTWVWFMDHLPTYDPEKASFTTWFNYKLKWLILEESRRALPPLPENNISEAAIPSPYAWENLLDEWIALVRRDPQLMKCRLQGNLRLSCQVLLLDILAALQETGVFSWEAIAQHQEIEAAVLKRFCRRRCFARFKELTSSE